MNALLRLLSLCAVAFVAIPAQAAPTAGNDDCTQARDPERCMAQQRARDICQGKTGTARRQCQRQALPQADCSKSRHPQRCEIMQKAQLACQDKFGPALRACINEHTATGKKPRRPAGDTK